MKKLFKSRYFLLIFIPISFIFTLIYSWTISPLFLGDDVDSSIFKAIGLGMTQGKLPYTDLFDHKGGLLFMIEALGWLLAPGRWGMYILQSFFISTSLIFLFKTSELFLDRCKAFGATMGALLLYVIFMESGNQCETYILPATTLTLYLALKYLTNGSKKQHPIWYSLIYGAAFAFAFWIRPNDAVSQIGSVMFGIFLFLIAGKEYANAIINALMFLVGCAIVTAPIIIYFASHDCLMPLLDGTFLYNIKYATEEGLPSAQMILVPSFTFGMLIWLSIKNHKKEYLWIFISMLVLTLMLIGKRDYGHYLIIIVPAGLVLFSMLLKQNWKHVFFVLMIGIAALSVRQHKYIIKSFQRHEELKAFYSQSIRIISNVPENEQNQIWNLNLIKSSNEEEPNIFSTLSVFADSRITPCNRVFVPFHLDSFPEEERVTAQKPKWILADPTMKDYGLYTDFLEQNYTVIDATDGTCTGDLILYKIKEDGE
jgi:hypothetical protein